MSDEVRWRIAFEAEAASMEWTDKDHGFIRVGPDGRDLRGLEAPGSYLCSGLQKRWEAWKRCLELVQDAGYRRKLNL